MTDIDFARNELAGEKGNRVPEYLAYAVNAYLLTTAKLLKLADWMIVVNDDEPKDENATATMNSKEGQKFVGVWLSDRFIDRDDPSLSNFLRTVTLIHELIHLHFEEAWHFAEDTFANFLGSQGNEIAEHVFRMKMEVGIDQLAYAIAAFVPEFKFPEPPPAIEWHSHDK